MNREAPLNEALDFIARPTPRLRTAVGQQFASLPPADFSEFIATIRSVFAKYTARLGEFEAGAKRGRALHQLMDQTLPAIAHLTVTCRKGCAGCCHYEVEITADDAAVLADLVRGGVVIDSGRLEIQAARERKSAEWANILRQENRCVFLSAEGTCRVYEHRPATCRKHLVTSPAEACSTPGQPVAPVDILLAEILLSAALSLEGTAFGSLSKMLQATLGSDHSS